MTALQFKFDANQEYQVQAVESIAGLFEGQSPLDNVPLGFVTGTGFAPVANRLDLGPDALLDNLRAIQGQNRLDPDADLDYIEQTIETASGPVPISFPNFSVEMETGTGKTYVYLRTILELHRRYRLRKFIVIVPSVAVREGVIKTLQVTRTHLSTLYDNTPYRSYVYDSAAPAQIRQFALSDGLEIMVMTLDSFNKADKNVIHQSRDQLNGQTPIHLIQATRPVLILDEPQNMESEGSVLALAQLHPLVALRYSATHRNPYNVVYRLTPFEAYRQGLVKRIEVASVLKEDDTTPVFLRLDAIEGAKRTFVAKIAVHKLMKDGVVKETVVAVKPGDHLEKKAGRPEYAGYEVDEINPGQGCVVFKNDVTLSLGDAVGADKDAIFEAQIRYTIEEHLRRQERFDQTGVGIKVLSLFFIDRVDNYAPDHSLIKRLFAAAYDDVRRRYPAWRDLEADTVQAAYFAQKRRKDGAVDLLDSVTGKAQQDEEAYNLIMRDKEKLLAREQPVAFIFSHSALREGWDNPNIFQICTLNQSTSRIKKRQEIGRGVRLAVDQSGDRVRDEAINRLVVVANESYERYVGQLQAEIAEEYGQENVPPPPPRAQHRTVTLNKERVLSPQFQDLWDKIKQRTRYTVTIDTEKLLADAMPAIEAADIRPPHITVTRAAVDVERGEDVYEARQMTARRTVLTLDARPTVPNLVDIMEHRMEYTSPPVRLTRETLLAVFRRLSAGRKRAAMANPQEFAAVAVRVLKEELAEQLVAGIEYERVGMCYEMKRLEASIEDWADYLVEARRSVYDYVRYDSEIERQFVQDLDDRGDVDMYIKLPSWFTVSTPVGEYNPDWAIVMKETDERGFATDRRIYLVRETKSTLDRSKWRPDERRKVGCGERHFRDTLGANYKVVTSAGDLP